ncbi:MAG: DNA primase [Levilactobacillus sp.]|uniref:DNA primase n=1 Tax=Levilactobacillus sp. TaxID=2767919 RepID=UPI00258CC451|nr:DNA primase [Levilactobacillus sp.]MCH4123287.1 DNA primase [Levilactobacillus sp.]MCI1552575.1 DNA primase [Levilactobacillus sp.]MCI1599310.1 DNA primase [Levilactobacillus sp.]MCI1606737.1 DNA primase [Levilactobacillus sp.]
MAKIPEDVIETVRTATNIADVVGQYVQLKKSGKNLFGLCPFHEERTPSFSVSEDKQIFHCFSCGRGGNVFKFLMELEHVSFPEAVVKVADFSHVDLDSEYRQDASGPKMDSKTSQLIDLQEQAAKLYHHVLVNTQVGQPALDYLHDRGLTDETIETYQLGFAPGQRLLKPFFEQRNSDYQLLRQSGLFIENAQGELRDRFTERVMFPLRNASGHVAAFSGRLIKKADDQPKYLNSPETALFNKSRLLFNFDLARPAIRQAGEVTLFEGYMDVISATQAGVHNGIASMGTSLTTEQIYAIERTTDKLNVCYDGDEPGQRAISRALTLLGQHSHLTLSVIQLPEGQDPDEYRRAHGDEAFRQMLTTAKEPPLQFNLRFLRRNKALDTDSEQLAYVNQVMPLLAQVQEPVELDMYLNQLANEFHIDKAALQAQLKQTQRDTAAQQERARPRQAVNQTPPETAVTVHQQNRPLTRLERAERGLLIRLLHDRNVWAKVTSIEGFSFVHDDYQVIYTLAQGYFQTHQTYRTAQFTDFIKEDRLQQIVIDLETATYAAVTPREIDDYLAIIMDEAPIDEQLRQKKNQLAEASRLGNAEQQRQLVIEIVQLEQQRQANKQL